LYESWTTLSRRPRLIADLNAGFLYFYTKEDLEYDTNRALLPNAPNYKSNALAIEQFYLSYKKQFGANYLVWKKDFTPLTFKEVYRNSKYIIYELPESRL
jgi:hypothetical protein